MNFSPFTPPFVTNLPATVTTLPPIITRSMNVVHRYNIINQPHIHEHLTQVCTHNIKRHFCCQRPLCQEHCTFKEEFCGCPGPMGPGSCGRPLAGVDFDNFDDVPMFQ